MAVATDNDATCAATYGINSPDTPFVLGAIGGVSTQQLLEAGNVRSGDIDLLVGGPPCPAFSKSRFYRPDKPRALQDPVAAETVGGYLRVLEEARPKAFLLENVRGLAYGVHRQALDHIIATAERLGYTVDWTIVNAADFGVPQIRERCFVIGSLYGKVELPQPTHDKSPTPLLGLDRWVTAGDVLRDLDSDENADDAGHFAGGQYHDLLTEIPPGSNYLHFTVERGHKQPKFRWRSRYWSFLLKLSPEMPSWTIQARRSNNMGPFHWRNRILRIEEIMRLQTFPDGMRFSGTLERQWRQIGNAVPPKLAEQFARAIYAHLQSHAALPVAA